MNHRVQSGAKPERAGMGIGIPRQQTGLKEHHARVPDARAASEKRQNHFGAHGLNEKEQARADKECESKQGGRDRATTVRRPRFSLHSRKHFPEKDKGSSEFAIDPRLWANV